MSEVARAELEIDMPPVVQVGESLQEKLLGVSESPVFDSSLLLGVLTHSPGGNEISMTQLFKESAGVWEGYSIGEHTQMVMMQFERYFADGYNSSLLSRGDFRVMLAIHDIGKPLAIQAGDKRRQHAYTRACIEKILEPFALPNQQRTVITEISTQDHIGSYIKGEITSDQAAANIKQLAQKINLPVADLTELLITYYMCDAGSYTQDAGGKRSLDNLFVFDREEKQLKGTMKFAQPQQAKLDALITSLAIKPEDIRNQEVDQSTSQDFPVSSKATRGEIREFSKSTEEGREARSKTAQEILKQRKNQLLTQKKIETVSQERKKTIDSSKYFETDKLWEEERILALQAELRNRFSSWVRRVKEKLRPSLPSSLLSKETLEREILRRQDRLSEIQAQKTRYETNDLPLDLKRFDEELRLLTEQRETLMSKSKEELSLFYEKFGKELNKRQGETKDLADLEAYRKKEGTVQKIVDRFNVYVVHGIFFERGGKNNAYLDRLATWKEKLMIAVSERNPVSASTILMGERSQLWSPIGIFMGEGVVSDACARDAATVVTASGKKEGLFGRNPLNITEYDQRLGEAITHNMQLTKGGFWHNSSRNELILDDNPRPVGFFINMDQNADYSDGGLAPLFTPQGLRGRYGYFTHEQIKALSFIEMFEVAHFVGLPTFAIKDGVAHEASLDSNGELVLGESVSPKEMIAMKTEIPQENLPKVREIVKRFVKPNGKSMASATV